MGWRPGDVVTGNIGATSSMMTSSAWANTDLSTQHTPLDGYWLWMIGETSPALASTVGGAWWGWWWDAIHV